MSQTLERKSAASGRLKKLQDLARSLSAEGKYTEAEKAWRDVLVIAPKDGEAHFQLGNALCNQGKFAAAISRYERAIAAAPQNVFAFNNIGFALHQAGRLEDAVSYFERAIAMKPDFSEARNNFGNLLQDLDRLEDAAEQYRQAIATTPEFSLAHNNLGNVLQSQGKFAEAEKEYQRALELNPNYAEAYHNHAHVKKFRKGDAELDRLEALAAAMGQFSEKDQVYIHFALSKALKDAGDYARSFEHLAKGNALKRKEVGYDDNASRKFFAELKQVFSAELFTRLRGAGDPSQTPIFVLGMPRSGSTLVEQILASHPRVLGGGELKNIQRIIRQLDVERSGTYPAWVTGLDAASITEIGKSYLGSLPALGPGQDRVTDKMPSNFLHLGIIHLALPNAKIVHTARNPMDTCFSCFSELFTDSQKFSYNLTELGRYYRYYAALMAHWRAVLPPGTILDVSYEDVVADLEGQAKRLIAYCGLEWDERCLAFHENDRPIATASSVQVRQPLYRDSVERWRRYGAYLGPLAQALKADGRSARPAASTQTDVAQAAGQPVPAVLVNDKRPIPELLTEAERQHRDGHLAEAEAFCQHILARQPENTAALSLSGVIFFQQRRYDDAAKQISKAIEFNKDETQEPIYRNTLGAIFRAQGRLAEAIAQYRSAIALNPNYADAYGNLGNALAQQNNLQEAIVQYEQAIALKPAADLHFKLANTLRGVGKLNKAAAHYRQALAINPKLAQAHNNLGAVLHDLKQDAEAEAEFRRALELRPNFVDACNRLGNLYLDQQKYSEAIALYERAITANPKFAEAYYNLGAALQGMEQNDKAIVQYEKALKINPRLVFAYNNLGNIFYGQKKYDLAVAKYMAALALQPNYAECINNLANALEAQGKSDAAIKRYRQAIALQPNYLDSYNNLGIVLRKQEKFEEAEEQHRRAVALNPDSAESHFLLANVYRATNDVESSIREYRRALELKPNYAEAHSNLASVLRTKGDFDEAVSEYDRAIALQPNLAEAYYGRSFLKTFSKDDKDLETLEALAANVDALPEKDQMALYFAMAKALEDAGKPERAFEYLIKGNALKRKEVGYDEKACLKSFDSLRKVFNKEFFGRLRDAGNPSKVPIFIVGMPRSGSTLTEQILACHPRIYGAGELRNMAKIMERVFSEKKLLDAYPESVVDLDVATLREIGDSYLSSLPACGPGEDRITDKMPSNFLHLGIIHLALPNAKIVHTMRNPVDTCVSCFSKLFGTGQEFTYDLAELGRYYRYYTELMAHWRSVLPPGTILDVTYEDVVADLEGQAKRLIDYCGLEWDPRCLDFHKNTRPIATASSVQVRQPLYRDSVERWRRYEAYLGPLLQGLNSKDKVDEPQPVAQPLQPTAAPGQPAAEKAVPASEPDSDPRSVAELRAEAERQHQAGRLAEAEALCRKILAREPENTAALSLSGIIAFQQRRYDEAADRVSKAIELNTDKTQESIYRNTLGAIWRAQGKLSEAIEEYRNAIALNPDYVDAYGNLGNALTQQGNLQEAADQYERAISLKASADLHFKLANTLKGLGKADKAAAHYRRALAINPKLAMAHNNLGAILRERGDLKKAITRFRRAIEIDPRQTRARLNLASALQELGKLPEAQTEYEHVIALAPTLASAYNDLGIVLQSQEKFSEAITRYEQAVAVNPKFAEGYSNLGAILCDIGRPAEALTRCQQALEIKPNFAEAHFNLANALRELHRLDEAIAHYKTAIKIKPDYISAYNNMGTVLQSIDKYDEALEYYRRVSKIKPDYYEIYSNIGNILKSQGKMAEAAEAYSKAIAGKPDLAAAHYNRADLLRFRPGDENITALEQLLANIDKVPQKDRAQIHFAYAKALEDIGEHSRSFENFLKGNALKRADIVYDEAAHLSDFKNLKRVFNAELITRLGNQGEPSKTPIFVLGMPRSGSTLVEQILSSHPRVYGAGELKIMPRIVFEWSGRRPQPFPDWIAGLNSAALKQMGREYLNDLPSAGTGHDRVTDKMPTNFLHVGLIHLALPNAKIVHTVRDPVDTCVSCFSKLFTVGQNFSYDLAELGRYYRQYRELMDHWRAVLPPGTILDVSYEDVVADLDGQAKRLIAYCGLEWDERCLAFHKNTRPIATASVAQVRRPLYRDSIERWRRYETYLQPLLKELGY